MTREGRLLSIYMALTTSVTGFLQPFVPIYLLESGLSKSQIGLVAGSSAALAFLVQPLLGKLSDRYDARRPFVAGMALLAAIAYLSFPFLSGAPAFLVAVALGSNATLYMAGVSGVLVGRLAVKGKGGATYAAYRVWGSIAYVFVALAVGLVLKPQGGHGRGPLNLVFEIGPLIFFAVAALAYWLPDPRRPVQEGEEVQPSKANIRPNLRRFLAVDFLYVISLYGATNFISIFMLHLGGRGPVLELRLSAWCYRRVARDEVFRSVLRSVRATPGARGLLHLASLPADDLFRRDEPVVGARSSDSAWFQLRDCRRSSDRLRQ